MCGRFARFSPVHKFGTLFGVQDDFSLIPRYNVAPTQAALAARTTPQGRRELVTLHWGLIPLWAKEPKTGYSTINARAETVATKPSFRHALRQRRCLIAADGFYEWKRLDGRKQPYYIRLKDRQPFAFAGLWEHWEGGGEIIDSCAIIVTQANELIGAIHDRMPVILDPADYELWLDPDAKGAAPGGTTAPALFGGADGCLSINTRVNNPKNDDRSLVAAIRER
ncbi:MAG: SOS response-associated peptidase [Gammaproteobacteria bacterium]